MLWRGLAVFQLRRASVNMLSLNDHDLGSPLSPLGQSSTGMNVTKTVRVPSSEHVAEIVGRQGSKIKALRAKTNTYIKTPVRESEPTFLITGRNEDVDVASSEIESAAAHFSNIRATKHHGEGQVVGHVRVPYKVVGLVVGQRGTTIKRIQQETDTYIVTPSRDRDPVFEITGLEEDVTSAFDQIKTHVRIRIGNVEDDLTDSMTLTIRSLGPGDPSPPIHTEPHMGGDRFSTCPSTFAHTNNCYYPPSLGRLSFDGSLLQPSSTEDLSYNFNLAMSMSTPGVGGPLVPQRMFYPFDHAERSSSLAYDSDPSLLGFRRIPETNDPVLYPQRYFSTDFPHMSGGTPFSLPRRD